MLRHGEAYRIGFFLVGAYQEILGDIHNLFGDTDAVEVAVDGRGYRIAQQRCDDTTDVMLDYVGYALDEVRRVYAATYYGSGDVCCGVQGIERYVGSRSDGLSLFVRCAAGVSGKCVGRGDLL